MPRSWDKSEDEFEMKRIHASGDEAEGEDKKPRSLIFRISKRSHKASKKDETVAISDLYTQTDENAQNDSDLTKTNTPEKTQSNGKNVNTFIKSSSPFIVKSEEFVECVSPLRLKKPSSTTKLKENKGPELRRTSRRIILRVNKDFVSDPETNKKKPGIPKEKRQITKLGSDCIKVEKRKSGRKFSSSAILKKPVIVKRGPGRPRKIAREFEISHAGPNILQKMITPNQNECSTVWTLVPKEVIDLEYFKYQIIKMHFPRPLGRKPKNAPIKRKALSPIEIPRLPFRKRETVDIQTHRRLTEEMPAFYQSQEPHQMPSNRPTVIYFKSPENYTSNGVVNLESKRPIIDQSSVCHVQENASFSAKQLWEIAYLRRKYSGAFNETVLEYVYGASHEDLQKTEELLSDILSEKKIFFEEHPGVVNIPNTRLPILQINDGDFNGDKRYQGATTNNTVSASQTTQSYVDTLFRQVIVESMRLLYDEESVLGFS